MKKFNFIKNYNEESEGYFLEMDVQYLEKLHKLLPFLNLPFSPKRMKIEKVKKLYMIKLNMLYTQEI